jgi:hypothetical protein
VTAPDRFQTRINCEVRIPGIGSRPERRFADMDLNRLRTNQNYGTSVTTQRLDGVEKNKPSAHILPFLFQ